jgi:GWxTD domain-containing protein
MKTKHIAIVLFPVLLASFLFTPAASAIQKAQKPKLPESYKKWLEEEVVYIIARMERDVFLKLQTDRERDLFIEAFWKQRDPTPGDTENEFKTEHFRRIAYANRYLGRDAPRPGWQTDRGRIYIILGAPRDIQRYEGKGQTYDTEVWFYQGLADTTLPAGFNVVFFKEGGTGRYKLYSPIGDGPQALLAGWYGGPDYESAYKKLLEIDPEIASISLSLVPGEPDTGYGRPSLSSDLLIQRIESSAARSIEANYAQKFLQYKDIVEVEYTANYLDSDSLIKVFRDPSGLYFVHYAIEPKRLSINQYENRFYTTLKVNGRVTTADGRLVYQFDKTISLDLTPEQMSGASQAPFDFQGIFPLLGGDYTVSVLLKNEASKEFTSIEQSLRVPQNGAAVQLTQPLLGYRVARLEPGERRLKAFRIAPFQVYCQPLRAFTSKETLVVAFQLNNLPGELTAGGEVKIEFLKDGQPFRDIRRKPSDYPELPNVVEEVSLSDFPPAHYTVRVSLCNAGAEIVASTEEFDLTFVESIPRPWFSSQVLPGAGDPVYSEIMGAQLFNLGRFEEARVLLERAFQRKPDSEATAASLARLYLVLSDAPAAVRILAPFTGRQEPVKYETFVLAGEALKRTGEFGRAVELLDQAIARYGVNASLLNSLGECHAAQGNIKAALAAYEKSLELSPAQPEVTKRVGELKKRK